MPPLTTRQQQILTAIRRQYLATGKSPTVREIGTLVGLKSSCSVQKHLEALEALGMITRSRFQYRSIELTGEAGMPFKQDEIGVPVPLLGRVAGGRPITAEQDADPEMLPIPAALLSRAVRDKQVETCATGEFFDAPLFALTVKGESMSGAGINSGDVVVAQRQTTARTGEIVIALVGRDEATVKRFSRENGQICLLPANAVFQPITGNDIAIVGKVIMAIKRF
jgi:repressor LexA